MFLEFDVRQGHLRHSDMRHDNFLNSTGDMGINKQQRHATLAFLKIDRRLGHPPSRAPFLLEVSPTIPRNAHTVLNSQPELHGTRSRAELPVRDKIRAMLLVPTEGSRSLPPVTDPLMGATGHRAPGVGGGGGTWVLKGHSL